jgi:alkylation response protein AidB-like acyl-CoA dehydrogenase
MTMTANPTEPTTDTGSGSPSTDWTAIAREVASGHHDEVVERDRTGEISSATFDRLRAAGLTSALVPSEHGGGGATHAEMGQILRELGRHDPATAVTLSMHAHLLAAQVWRHKHGIDATPVFQKVVGGAVLVSTGASDWVPSNGRAEKVDGGYKVWARKGPASGCEVGQILVTSIRWDDAPEGPQVFHCSVPMSAEGVSIDLTWDTLGQRATGSHTVVLDGVFVPEAAISLMRPADAWHPVWNVVMGAAMPLICSAYLGIADNATELAREVVAGRAQPHILQLLGEMANAHTTAEDVITAMFADSDDLQFANTDELASRTLSRKTVAADAMIDTVRLAIEATGGVGYTRSSDLERLYRDIHGCLFHPLARAKQTQFTGRVALGLSPYA